MLYQVVWDIKAKESLRAIYLYIKEASPSAAIMVRKEILNLTASLQKMPERFSTETYLKGSNKEFRSVSLWSYKIIYRIHEQKVRILDIIHTKRNTALIEKLDF
ncbi:type II toxin-antitoxin system RelE/ParE family toxin [Pedobacter aquae]|uniref:Type II toxin-antitoxin system RelE/ParE family toxin n=1 Tax=Pedobacter aquae TaxID=2605747 RepID=A0A5C0VGV5_9SPHI|nr:type II toxin-antitoxin system RelE/ParE family toxin [Pedobacter aquae]QEK51915.1 type II toxin-antitoxin system RelE/ParE family toxin [Pedobacter aquae]